MNLNHQQPHATNDAGYSSQQLQQQKNHQYSRSFNENPNNRLCQERERRLNLLVGDMNTRTMALSPMQRSNGQRSPNSRRSGVALSSPSAAAMQQHNNDQVNNNNAAKERMTEEDHIVTVKNFDRKRNSLNDVHNDSNNSSSPIYSAECCGCDMVVDRRLLAFFVQSLIVTLVLIYSMYQVMHGPSSSREAHIIIITTILSVYLNIPLSKLTKKK